MDELRAWLCRHLGRPDGSLVVHGYEHKDEASVGRRSRWPAGHTGCVTWKSAAGGGTVRTYIPTGGWEPKWRTVMVPSLGIGRGIEEGLGPTVEFAGPRFDAPVNDVDGQRREVLQLYPALTGPWTTTEALTDGLPPSDNHATHTPQHTALEAQHESPTHKQASYGAGGDLASIVSVSQSDGCHSAPQKDVVSGVIDEVVSENLTQPPRRLPTMSDSTVIQPAPGQAILTTSDDHHGHRGHRGRDNDDWERAILREQAAGFRTAAVDAQTVMRDIKDSRFDVSGDVGRAATAAALASCKTDDAICGLAKDTAVGFKDGLVTAYQVEGRSLLEAAKNANALAVQADKNFYALSVENVKNAAAAQLEAQKNASAIAAQVAECCCELKGLVTGEHVATRGLIEGNEKARMAAVIVELQNRLLRIPPLPV